MPHPRDDDPSRLQAVYSSEPRVEYLVRRREDFWMIEYDGDEFGPYKSPREAMFFAIDVAQKLGEQGKETQVRLVDSAGQSMAAWTYGMDAYPPRL